MHIRNLKKYPVKREHQFSIKQQKINTFKNRPGCSFRLQKTERN